MDKKLICKVPCNDESISIEYYFFKGRLQNYIFSIWTDKNHTFGYRWIVPIIHELHNYEDFVDLAEGYFEEGECFAGLLDHFFDRELIALISREKFLEEGFYIDLEGNRHRNETD